MKQIEELRYKLTAIADEKGYTHKDTIILSQALDCLLNKYNAEYTK